jgi:GNAT superfamily N-acetyltransferase
VLNSDDEINAAFPIAASLRDRLQPDTFLADVRRQQRDGYELIGAFEDNQLVALAGTRPGHTLARGEHVFVDDLVISASRRGEGHGRALLKWIAARAIAAGVPRIYLDSRDSAKGFYEELGFTFLTSLPSWIDSDQLA